VPEAAALLVGDARRDVLRATGAEATDYLQGQLSQDVAALAPGAYAWSWLLAPNGKVDALLRLTRLAEDEWLLDTDAGAGAGVLARLVRFRLRTKVDIEATDLGVTALRGEGWEPAAPPGTVLSPPWPGVAGADVITTGANPPGDADDLERARILAGVPRMGAELDERTIPAETGLVAMTVSFTKGCYTGQELVARIDSRGGNVPRRLRGLRFPPGIVPARGAELAAADGAPAGVVTSAVAGADGGAAVGLGYIRRAVPPDATLRLADGPGRAEVEQVELPR
jgi:folate-binding protein YgfZ